MMVFLCEVHHEHRQCRAASRRQRWAANRFCSGSCKGSELTIDADFLALAPTSRRSLTRLRSVASAGNLNRA